MKVSNLIALLTNRNVQGNAYVKDGELYQGNTAQAILVKDENELDEVKKHVAPGSIAYTAGYGSMWQLSAAGSWEEIQEEGGSGGGGGMMLLNLTPTETGAIADATYAEVKAAMYAGKSVGFIYNYSGEHSIYQLQKCIDSSSPSHEDPHVAEFYNMSTTSEFSFHADTEDSLLYFDPSA